MKLTKRFEIQSKENIINFLNNQQVGRLATIDNDGFPQIIPMNFVYIKYDDYKDYSNIIQKDGIYMHSHPFGEKLDNIIRDSHTGFEVDQHIAFLPSYYFHPTDASQADTLYISIVIKGHSFLVENNEEKSLALNALMEKYQKEGRYTKLNSKMSSVQHVTVIKFTPDDMRGKYKIGQDWTPSYRVRIAKNIIAREKGQAKLILSIMGINILPNGNLQITNDPLL